MVMAESVRTFVSVKAKVTDRMEDVASQLRSVRGLRVPQIGQLHITLCFLGDVDAGRLPSLCDALERSFSGFGAFDLRIKGMGAFPKVSDPRVVWMGLDDSSALMRAAETVRKTVDELGLDYDGKRFSPHVTVARVSGSADVADIIASNRDTLFSEFRVTAVNVMKSELGQGGARHSVIRRIELE